MNRTYFKAVHPDGIDFRTGKVHWLPAEGVIPAGGWAVEHPASGRVVCADPRTYLSVSTVATDCTGMRWPCRLLRVVPDGRQVRIPNPVSMPRKRVSIRWRVTEELPAWQALGPQGREIETLLRQIGSLTEDQTLEMSAARDAARNANLDAARGAARWAARDTARYAARYADLDAGLDNALDDARRAALNATLNVALGTARDAAWNATLDAARGAARWAARDAARVAARKAGLDAALDDARRAGQVAALNAAWNAALGLLVKDLISGEDFRTLTGPWESVMGPIEVTA